MTPSTSALNTFVNALIFVKTFSLQNLHLLALRSALSINSWLITVSALGRSSNSLAACSITDVLGPPNPWRERSIVSTCRDPLTTGLARFYTLQVKEQYGLPYLGCYPRKVRLKVAKALSTCNFAGVFSTSTMKFQQAVILPRCNHFQHWFSREVNGAHPERMSRGNLRLLHQPEVTGEGKYHQWSTFHEIF